MTGTPQSQYSVFDIRVTTVFTVLAVKILFSNLPFEVTSEPTLELSIVDNNLFSRKCFDTVPRGLLV